jgi:hypothetical protein
VVTVIVELVFVILPVAAIEDGLNTHAAPPGSPVQASAMVPVKPVE